MEKSEVKEFYKGTKVFITGGTGFVGKTLIEKLLRITQVATIYLLIREKKGKKAEERLENIFDNPVGGARIKIFVVVYQGTEAALFIPTEAKSFQVEQRILQKIKGHLSPVAVFDLLKNKDPDYQQRVKIIVGECGLPGFGISEIDRKELESNVNVIFHAAATVNFDENLKSAYDINFKGIKTVIEMAKNIKSLKSLVFVSTAYSNCIRKSVINEEVYEYSYEEVIDKLENMSRESAEQEKKKMIGQWPNTYTFTKALSEMLVKRERKNVPIGIFRPSIIMSTYREPIPGWIDNMYGINGIAVGLMTGFLRVYRARPDVIVDVVPVDMCISALLVAAKEIHDAVQTESDVRVYNYIGGNENPVTNDLLRYLNLNFGVPAEKAIWYPSGVYISNLSLAPIVSFILEIIPAFFMDALAILTGNKPQLLSLYSKVIKFSDKVSFFGQRDWEFNNDNVKSMWNKLNKVDQDIFPFSMAELSWVNFCKSYSRGLRKYVLKEENTTLDKAYTKYYRFRVAHYAVKALSLYVICSVINLILCKFCKIIFS